MRVNAGAGPLRPLARSRLRSCDQRARGPQAVSKHAVPVLRLRWRGATLRTDACAAARRRRPPVDALDHGIGTSARERSRGAPPAGGARVDRDRRCRRRARFRKRRPRLSPVGAAAVDVGHRARGRGGNRGARAIPSAACLRRAGREAGDARRARSRSPADRRGQRPETVRPRAGGSEGGAAAGAADHRPRRRRGQGDRGPRPGQLGSRRGARPRDSALGSGPARRGDTGRDRAGGPARGGGGVGAQHRRDRRSASPRRPAPPGADGARGSAVHARERLGQRPRRALEDRRPASVRVAPRHGALTVEGGAAAGAARRSSVRRTPVAATHGRLRGAARHPARGRPGCRRDADRRSPLGAGTARRRLRLGRRRPALRVAGGPAGMAARDHAAAGRAARRRRPHRGHPPSARGQACRGDGAVRDQAPRWRTSGRDAGCALPRPLAARAVLRPL